MMPIAKCAETLDEALSRAAAEYTEKIKQAGAELQAARERIAKEKTPLLQKLREMEDRTLAAEEEAMQVETAQEHAQERRRRLIKDTEALHKNTSYMTTLAQDAVKAYADTLAPGEAQVQGQLLEDLQRRLGSAEDNLGGKGAVDTAQFLLDRLHQNLGGYAVHGRAMADEDNRVQTGTFVFMGPETYFIFDHGEGGLAMHSRESGEIPVAQVLSHWNAPATTGFIEGKPSTIPADATAGKALRLKQTKGTLFQHVEKGGVVAYAILAVGALSLLLILSKIRDLSRLEVDGAERILDFLGALPTASAAELRQRMEGLKSTTRELYGVGLKYKDAGRIALEERLRTVLLRQRLFYERRLPLLAVIATAAPLMGLLGTVVGMVRTFALITVFGTGNAGKLASGISEVLVATELGLMVAIPTLIAHGFLAHRIHKNLATLETYAIEFVTASQSALVV